MTHIDCIASALTDDGQRDEFGEPLHPCPTCGGGYFWRLSRTEPRFSGRWWCAGCSPPPADRWCDAAILGAVGRSA